MIQFVPARRIHVGPIATRMRPADQDESAALGFTPHEALRRGLASSSLALVAVLEGRACAMIGLTVTSAIAGEGQPWMLATDAAYSCGRDLVRQGGNVIREMRLICPRLSNIVGRENHRAIRMLRRWGFEVDHAPIVMGGMDFLRFRMS